MCVRSAHVELEWCCARGEDSASDCGIEIGAKDSRVGNLAVGGGDGRKLYEDAEGGAAGKLSSRVSCASSAKDDDPRSEKCDGEDASVPPKDRVEGIGTRSQGDSD